MPRMILLNGPPGAGKSTLAQRYVDAHPLSLNLDMDRIRGLLGGWRQDPRSAGLLARAVTLAAAGTHLEAGYDVVIPQFFGRPDFIEQVEQLAQRVGAEFHEIVLLDTKENTLQRFSERTRLAADPAHLEAQELLDRLGGMAELAAMYDRLLQIISSRPRARVISVHAGQVEQAYQHLLASLELPDRA